MPLSFMRVVDRWLGIPLCLLLSLWQAMTRRFRSADEVAAPRRILFIQISEMGSMVLAYPMIRKARSLYPHAELFFLTFRQNRYAIDILNVLPEENVLTIDADHLRGFLRSTFKALFALRRLRIDTVFDLELFARFSAIVSFLSGAKTRVGYFRYHHEGLYRGDLVTRRVAYNPHIHMAHNLLNLAYACTERREERPHAKRHLDAGDITVPTYDVPEADRKRMREALRNAVPGDPLEVRNIILLNPNASDLIPLRRWPRENYIDLARRLLAAPERAVVITGTAAEFDAAEGIREAVGSPRCLNFAGLTSFTELLALYAIADLLVTNDSGPVHFSTLVGIPSLALFGPETPDLYGPLGTSSRVLYARYSCSPCVSAFNHRRSACVNNRCLKAITVAQVLEEIGQILE